MLNLRITKENILMNSVEAIIEFNKTFSLILKYVKGAVSTAADKKATPFCQLNG